jgi:hypothetical protein
MSTSHGHFSISSFRNLIKGLKEKSFVRKTKNDIWEKKFDRLLRDMKLVIEEAKDPETLQEEKWPGGHVCVKELIGFALKYIEVVNMHGRIPRSYSKHIFIELDLGLDAMEINDIDSIDGVEVKDFNNEDT